MLRADLLRPIKCRSVLLAAAFVFLLSGRSQAAPLCAADSLTNYLSLGSCSIGGATFSNFSLVTPLPTGATAVPANSVIVLPFSTDDERRIPVPVRRHIHVVSAQRTVVRLLRQRRGLHRRDALDARRHRDR